MGNQQSWITVGQRSDLLDGAGVGAQIGHAQVALFYFKHLDQVFALSNLCPFSGVNIMARGIVGDIQGEPVVASPLHKEHFSLLDGRCLEQPSVSLAVWQVRLDGEILQVQPPPSVALTV